MTRRSFITLGRGLEASLLGDSSSNGGGVAGKAKAWTRPLLGKAHVAIKAQMDSSNYSKAHKRYCGHC